MNNLLKRIITALIGATLLISAIFVSPIGFWLVCFLISVLGLREFFHLVGLPKKPLQLWGTLLAIIVWSIPLFQLLLEVLTEIPDSAQLFTFALIFPLSAIFLLFSKHTDQALSYLSLYILGFIYCLLPFYLFFDISVPAISDKYQPWMPFAIFWLTWSVDTGAYFAGRFLGKRPLYPKISPKKTWEGAIGGALICLVFAYIFQNYIPQPNHVDINWYIVAAIILSVGQAGDLVESMLKRNLEIKDSGSILPGHGGILDRFDGLLLSLPVIYLYFLIIS